MGERVVLAGRPAQTDVSQVVGLSSNQMQQVTPGIGSIESVRQEIDDAFADMKTFHNREPDDVMRLCGGHSARLQELRVQIQRVEVMLRQWKPIRTNEIEPAIDELRNQYQIASRLHSVRELDFKMAGGVV